MQVANTQNLQEETPDIVSSSADYARRFSGSIGAWFLKIQAEATIGMLRGLEGSSVLDVGGGHAQLARPLATQGFRVTVLGSSAECQQNITDLVSVGRCSFALGSLITPPFPDRSFDVVVSFRIISHLEQWQKYLASLCRIARKAVIVDYPLQRGIPALNSILFNVKRGIEGNTRSYLTFRESDVLKQCADMGFEFSQRYAQYCLPMVCHRVLKSPRLSQVLESALRQIGITYFIGSPVIIKVVRGDKS